MMALQESLLNEMDIVPILKGFGLIDIDIAKAFAAMIKRKVLNLKEDNDNNDDMMVMMINFHLRQNSD